MRSLCYFSLGLGAVIMCLLLGVLMAPKPSKPVSVPCGKAEIAKVQDYIAPGYSQPLQIVAEYGIRVVDGVQYTGTQWTAEYDGHSCWIKMSYLAQNTTKHVQWRMVGNKAEALDDHTARVSGWK